MNSLRLNLHNDYKGFMRDKNHLSHIPSDLDEDFCDIPSIDDERQESNVSSAFMKHTEQFSSNGQKVPPDTRSLNIKLLRDINSSEKDRRFTDIP